MKYFLLLLVIIATYGALEHYAIIPLQPYGVLNTLEILALFIKSLNIHTYYLIIPEFEFTVEGILLLFLVLFIVGYISERFRSLEQECKMLSKKVQELNNNKSEPVSDNDKTDEMRKIATDISQFLEKLSASVTVNTPSPIRSKTIRRVASEHLSNDDVIHEDINDTHRASELPEEIINNNESSKDDMNVDSESSAEKAESDSLDNDISSIDLAKALIQSDEKEKAREVLLDIIKNGSSSDAHEARLLNLQIS
tara:strand:- start:1158 stop:1916 length:759 start_codon:yes stop_codon:yes gene_type:complete